MQLKEIQILTLCLTVCFSAGYSKGPKKIINGWNASHREFPYQVSLQRRTGHYCGGSIIDATHILTAAHCVYTDSNRIYNAHEIQVMTSTIDNQANGRVYAVAEITPHNNYIPKTRTTPDIAILRLATPITFDAYQVAINLASRYTPPNQEVIASGWGVAVWLEKRSQTVRYLQKLGMRIVDLKQCAAVHPHKINEGNICAISAPGSAVCQGDSGGPLVHGNELVGIVSWGIPCAKGYPDVFTSVAYYLPWIRSTMSYH